MRPPLVAASRRVDAQAAGHAGIAFAIGHQAIPDLHEAYLGQRRPLARGGRRPGAAGLGMAEDPIAASRLVGLQQDVGAPQHDKIDLHLPREQRQQLQLHLQTLQRDHLGPGAAREVGEAQILDGERGRQRKRQRHLAVDGELAAGRPLHFRSDEALVLVVVDRHDIDGRPAQKDDQHHQYGDQDGLDAHHRTPIAARVGPSSPGVWMIRSAPAARKSSGS